ncbi:MAG TPA: hypothetical protein VHM65_00580 [Candidatus Lustribacter sp.]|nr:hypothetical protein [Candidatus Lustribacter sp.]
MQATVHAFDDTTGSGVLIGDDGLLFDLPTVAFAGSGLRHLRPGQRLTIERTEDGAVTRVWMVGVGDGQPVY